MATVAPHAHAHAYAHASLAGMALPAAGAAGVLFVQGQGQGQAYYPLTHGGGIDIEDVGIAELHMAHDIMRQSMPPLATPGLAGHVAQAAAGTLRASSECAPPLRTAALRACAGSATRGRPHR